MKRMLAVTSTGLVAVLAALSLPGQPSRAGGTRGKIRIGLVETLSRGLPPALLRTVLEPFKAYLEEQTGLSGELVLGGDAPVLGKKLRDGQVQLAVFHGHEFGWAREKFPKLQALGVCDNKGRDARVVLVVRKDNSCACVADLKGKVVSLPRLNRAYCRLFAEKHCVCDAATPEKYYSRVLTPFAVEDGLNQVFTRRAACVVVDAMALEEYTKAHPARAKDLRTLKESEPFPGAVLACYEGNFPAENARKLQAGLLAAKDSPRGQKALKSLRVPGFESPSDDYFSALAAIVKAYPPPRK